MADRVLTVDADFNFPQQTQDKLNAAYVPLAPSALADNLPAGFLVAHRGGTRIAPEQTMTAYRNTVAAGVAAIECDVRVLADGSLALMHDATVDRTTTSSGDVADHTYLSWKQLTIDSDGLIPGIQGQWPVETPPTLAEFLREFGNRVHLYLGRYAPTTVADIDAVVEQYGINKQTITYTTNSSVEAGEANALGYVGRVLIAQGFPPNWDALEPNGVKWIGPHFKDVDQAYVDDAHGRGVKVVPFGATTHTDVEAMVALGCDGVSTDSPVMDQRDFRLPADKFAVGLPFPGQRLAQGSDPGKWFGEGSFGWDVPPSGTAELVSLAYMNLNADLTTQSVTITFDCLLNSGGAASAGANWAYFAVMDVDDYNTAGGSTSNGYRFGINDSGSLADWYVTDGNTNNHFPNQVSPTGWAVDTWINYTIIFDPNRIRFHRTNTPTEGVDNGGPNGILHRDVMQHLIIGRANAGVQFRNINISVV